MRAVILVAALGLAARLASGRVHHRPGFVRGRHRDELVSTPRPQDALQGLDLPMTLDWRDTNGASYTGAARDQHDPRRA